MNARIKVAIVLLATLIAGRATGDEAKLSASADPRDVQNGFVIPDEGYCDQPYVVVTKDGNWLCVLTTGAGREGQIGQHVVSTISRDKGRTWSKPIDIEPADGPEASWATPLLVPSGRVYVFYDYNGDKIRTLGGKPARADMLGWYCYRYSDDHGAGWSAERFRLPVRVTACDRGNDWGGSVQIFWGISKPISANGSAWLAFTKLGKHLLEDGEGWFFRSDNILTETNVNNLHWELLPDGEHGLRHPQFGSVQEEHNVVSLSNGDLYCIYRTTTGYPCHAYSRDGGRTWTEPVHATYTPTGAKIKHPRACPKIWRTAGGRYLLWFHNHAGKTFEGRNPAWICGGVEKAGMIHWSQPEIVLYDEDPAVRMSYPDLIEQDGRTWITETQKTVARVHEVDPALFEGLWREVAATDKPAPPARADLAAEFSVEQIRGGEAPLSRLPLLARGQGFSVEMRLRPRDLSAGRVLADATDSSGRGWRVVTGDDGRLRIELGDGKLSASWSSDRAQLKPDQAAHVVITVDGGAKTITFVVDGALNDGGDERPSGWGRIDRQLADVNAAGRIKFGPSADEALTSLRIYGRPLRNYEAAAAFRSSNRLAP